MERRARVRGAGVALLAVATLLTGCGLRQDRGTGIELVPVTPSPSASALFSASTPASSQDCFEVAEVISGMELLPLTDQAEDEGQADDALGGVRAAADEVRNQLPQDVQPSFDRARAVLDGAGQTLQPAEAVQLHKALGPAQTWLESRCGSPSPHAG